MIYYISKTDPLIKEIIRRTFPEYKGRKIRISTDIPSRLDSYWDGGSRDYYAFCSLDEKKAFSVPSNHPLYEGKNPRTLKRLPERILLVRQSIFCGKDLGITIFVNESDMTKFLPENNNNLPEDEKTVLEFTSGLKSSYAGISNYRFYEARASRGITLERWNEAKASLIQKKLLNKAGAITPNGRNALNQNIARRHHD